MLNRRSLLAGGLIAAAAPHIPPSSASAAGSDVATADTRHGIDVSDFAPADPSGDWTEAFQDAIDLAARGYARVLVPNGTYRVRSLVIPHRVKIVGLGADIAYFGGSGEHAGGVNLDRIDDGSGAPMLTVTGPGVTIESLTLRGRGVRAPILHVRNGFESVVRSVRAVDCPTTAVFVDQLNNSLWEGLFVNDCGSDTDAAMVIRSPSMTGTNTNAVKFVHLTIEGSANVALDIAWGSAPADYAEFLRFVTPHIESETSSGDAVVRIGNVRSVQFDDPFFYGGPGRALVEYRHQRFRGVELEGGVRFVGGTLLGANAGLEQSPHLVRLGRGNDVAFLGSRMGQFGSSAVRIDPDFGPDVVVDASTFVQGFRRADGSLPPLLDDQRRAAVTVTPGSANAGASASIDGSVTHGTIAFDAVADARAGSMALVRFPAAFPEVPVVHLTPLSAPAASAAPWAYVSDRYFLVSFANRPPLLGTTTQPYRFAYRVERSRR